MNEQKRDVNYWRGEKKKGDIRKAVRITCYVSFVISLFLTYTVDESAAILGAIAIMGLIIQIWIANIIFKVFYKKD